MPTLILTKSSPNVRSVSGLVTDQGTSVFPLANKYAVATAPSPVERISTAKEPATGKGSPKAKVLALALSLVPRPHPASGDSSLVTIEGFLGSADSALTDKRAH